MDKTVAIIAAVFIGTIGINGISQEHVPDAGPLQPDPVAPVAQTLHVTSREVVVDVMVTDSQGQPIHGLQASNFTIQENGRPQGIHSFREVSSPEPVTEPPGPMLPRGVYTNSQSTPTNGPVNILLLDALHSIGPANMIHALKAASDYISSMPKGTKVAIFWLSESGLHMMQGFTSDPATLMNSMRHDTIEIGTNQEHHTTDWYTIDALNQIAAYVAGIKGRKNLLWITSGMPVSLLRDGGYSWSDGTSSGVLFGGMPEGPDMGMVHRLMDVYERFTAEQIAVSPIDPVGVEVPDDSAEPTQPGAAFIKQGAAHLKVEAVAEQTGGEAFYNMNDLKSAIAKAIGDQSHFYTLSYIPPNQKDDAHYHTIKIQVDRPGLHLVYREGYNAERIPTPDAPSPGPDLLKASMLGNTPARTEILFDVGVWPSPPSAVAEPAGTQPKKPSKSKAILYEVHFGFPSSEVAFLEDLDGTLHGSLEFDIAAYNADRKPVAQLAQTVKLLLSPAEYDDFMAKPYRYNQQINLPPGPISLHVGILDNVSNKVGTLEVSVTVPRK